MPADFKEEHVKELVQGQALYAQGLLRQSWELDLEQLDLEQLDLEQLDSKQHRAACIFEADSTPHLQGMIDSFPNVKTDYVDYQVFPLKPDPAYTQKC